MTSEGITYVTFTRDPQALGGAKPRVALTDAEKAGTACIICIRAEKVTSHTGYIDGHSVKIHPQCEGSWYGE